MNDQTHIASQPAAAPTPKAFDVALVDPANPAIEHWPRRRVTIAAATLDDLPADSKKPPPGGESTEAETKRLAWLLADIERQRAIAAYNAAMRLDGSMLRYDVVPAAGDAPQLPAAWIEHLRTIRAS